MCRYEWAIQLVKLVTDMSHICHLSLIKTKIIIPCYNILIFQINLYYLWCCLFMVSLTAGVLVTCMMAEYWPVMAMWWSSPSTTGWASLASSTPTLPPTSTHRWPTMVWWTRLLPSSGSSRTLHILVEIQSQWQCLATGQELHVYIS